MPEQKKKYFGYEVDMVRYVKEYSEVFYNEVRADLITDSFEADNKKDAYEIACCALDCITTYSLWRTFWVGHHDKVIEDCEVSGALGWYTHGSIRRRAFYVINAPSHLTP